VLIVPQITHCNKNQQNAHSFTLMFLSNYIVFDMFRTSKCSSSGRLVQAHPDIDQTAYTDA